jgi:hypothetical protein
LADRENNFYRGVVAEKRNGGETGHSSPVRGVGGVGFLPRLTPWASSVQSCDHTDERRVWMAFGAPPVGTVDDLGAYVIPGRES